MADPIVDEEEVIALLRSPITGDHIPALQQGAMQALLDLYDRKVTRDEFINAASPCVALYGQTQKMWLILSIQAMFEQGTLEKTSFANAITECQKVMRKQCEIVIETVKRMQMCPTSQDKVH